MIVAENHRREIPEAIMAAATALDPDRRVLAMLGAPGSHVAATWPASLPKPKEAAEAAS